MAASKLVLLIFSIIFGTLIFTTDSNTDDIFNSDASDPSLKLELDQLNSRISILESSNDERTRELKNKDENIAQLEKIIQEKSTSVNSLKSEVQFLQERGSLDAKYEVVKAYARAGDLEKQVDSLRKEIEIQTKKKAALEARANLAEKKIQNLNLKLENLQKVNDEQKNRIRKTERALQLAEEEIMKAQLEVADISQEVKQVNGAWIPPWLAVHLVHSQTLIITQWNDRGRPALDFTIQKVLEKKTQFENWVEPHIDTYKAQWIPAIREWWFEFVTNIEPSVQLLTAKTVDVYHASKNTIGPHIVKVQKTVDPYIKEAKKLTEPYVNQISIVAKPHVDAARVFLKPYTKKVHRGYKKSIKTVATYHRQVRAMIHEMLKGHEFTKPYATNELVWYMTSAVMALPVIILFNMVSSSFSKKPKKRTHHSHASHKRRRAKRVHPDK